MNKNSNSGLLSENPTDKQILLWLNQYELPETCLEAVKGWIEVFDEDRIHFGPGFSVSVASIAISLGVEYEDAILLEAYIEKFSDYSLGKD